jgi:hypothetical protein
MKLNIDRFLSAYKRKNNRILNVIQACVIKFIYLYILKYRVFLFRRFMEYEEIDVRFIFNKYIILPISKFENNRIVFHIIFNPE